MKLEVPEVFDEYPNPLFIIRPIFVNGVSVDFSYEYVNKAFCIFLGRSRDELVNHRFREYYGEGERNWLDLFANAATGKILHDYVNNISILINREISAEVIHVDPDLCGCVIHDFKSVSTGEITSENEIMYQQQELRYRANYDYLTGFYNRFYLKELESSISEYENTGVTFLDINNLKSVNDSSGHDAGDKLIKKVSDIIRKIYKNSLVFRIGGDEFLIISSGLDEDEFNQLSANSCACFERENLVACGYKFYKKIDNLSSCISECDSIMYCRKKQMKSCVNQ